MSTEQQCNCQHRTGRLTPNCRAVHSPTEAICTRSEGHDGPHKACTSNTHPYIVWRQDVKNDVIAAVQNARDFMGDLFMSGWHTNEIEEHYHEVEYEGEHVHAIFNSDEKGEFILLNAEQSRFLRDLEKDR